MKRLSFAIFLMGTVNVTPLSVSHADTFTITTFEIGDAITAAEIVKKAYNKLGHNVVISVMPPRRSIATANNGGSDGELIRIAGTVARFPNLIRVPVPIMVSNTSVLTRKKSTFSPLKWEELNGMQFGIPIGVKLLKDRTIGMGPVEVPTALSLMKMIQKGRLVAGVMPMTMAMEHSDVLDQLRIVKPYIEIVELFHFVHKRNKNLVDKLAVIFTEMNLTLQQE